MLGELTECLTCDDAAIKEEKVDIQIDAIQSQLTHFDKADGEYQILVAELNKLKGYKEQRMSIEE